LYHFVDSQKQPPSTVEARRSKGDRQRKTENVSAQWFEFNIFNCKDLNEGSGVLIHSDLGEAADFHVIIVKWFETTSSAGMLMWRISRHQSHQFGSR